LGGLVAGVRVDRAAQKIKKPNEALSLKVVGDVQLGYLHRKLLNVMIKVAQDEKQPGRRLPPEVLRQSADDIQTAREYFWAPLEEFVRDARYESNDTKFLKEALTELQSLKVVSDGTEWLSEVPVPSVRIVSSPGRASWVGFAFAPETRRLVMRPRQYTEILLQTQRLLHSGPAIALYERCRQYLTSPGKKTARAPWTDWYYLLSGQSMSKPPPPFKYWNRDTLKRVEAEINAVTDIRIERIEFRVGRQIEDLQYSVVENPQAQISFPGRPPINTQVRDRLLALRIPADKADRFMSEYDEGLLLANLAYVEEVARRGGIRHRPEQYLKAALDKNFAGNVKTATATLASVQQAAIQHDPNGLKEAYLAERAGDALRLFRERDEAAQSKLIEDFLAGTNNIVRDQYARGGLNAPLVAHSLAAYYAQLEWGDPTDAELLKFANHKLKVMQSAS